MGNEPRGDAPLIKHLARQRPGPDALATARAWQALPYVRLPGDEFARYLWGERERLTETMPEAQLPWADAVYDLADGRQLFMDLLGWSARAWEASFPSRGQCWLRVTALPAYLRRERVASPWLGAWSRGTGGSGDLLAPFRAAPDRWIAVEVWEAGALRPDGTSGFPAYPDVSIIPRADPWDAAGLAHLYPNPACRSGRAYGPGFCHVRRCKYGFGDPRQAPCLTSDLLMSVGVMMAVLTLAYLDQSDELVVEVRSERPARGRRRNPKPWLDTDLPHHILIDPARVREYGHPSAGGVAADTAGGVGGESGARHGSPRGHWRYLRHERFRRDEQGRVRRIRVREPWEGAPAWTAGGRRYRVVAPPEMEGGDVDAAR